MNPLKVIAVVALLIPLLTQAQKPIDKHATRPTKNLLSNLKLISQKGFLFGHQDDDAYGVGWKAEDGRSDVKETSGSFPAVHGWDVGKRLSSAQNIDSVRFINMVSWIKKTYTRGGISTLSWHLDNLTTDGDAWDQTPSVKDILPGGTKNEAFVEQLDMLANLLNACTDGKKMIPIIFRPWHEHNGNWFWWGRGNCTEEEYIKLFKFTVDYLKNEKDVHHLLYAFSPDRSRLNLDSNAVENYLYGYPGDDYVDIIGLDNYGDVGRSGGLDSVDVQRDKFLTSLKLITAVAREKDKVAALTETGLEGVTRPDWFTSIILNPVKEADPDIDIAWVLVWRNANETHHYAPYKGHVSEPDFKKFAEDPYTYFESDLLNPYKKRKALQTN